MSAGGKMYHRADSCQGRPSNSVVAQVANNWALIFCPDRQLYLLSKSWANLDWMLGYKLLKEPPADVAGCTSNEYRL
jgi:hypothetical protein